MSGFGNSPFGRSPFGIGTPPTSPGNAGAALTDSTGAVYGSRRIDPATRRYVFDANGRIAGMPDVASLVLLALTTKLGSSALATLGDSPPSGVIGRNFVSTRKQSVQLALAPLVTQSLIEVVDVSVDTSQRPIFTLIRWRDLTTQTEHELTL